MKKKYIVSWREEVEITKKRIVYADNKEEALQSVETGGYNPDDDYLVFVDAKDFSAVEYD